MKASAVNDMSIQRRHYFLSGSVQGVGLRWRAKNIADMLSITGWVRNLYDERVEMEIQGAPKDLDMFISKLGTQHFIHIDAMQCTEITPEPSEHDFEIVGE